MIVIETVIITCLLLYFLLGFWLWQKGIEHYGGKDAYKDMLKVEYNMSNRFYSLVKIVFLFTWPLFLSRGDNYK